MKKSEFKKILRPLIEECIRESVLEGGVISNIITEVIKGVGAPRIVAEAALPARPDPAQERMQRNAFGTEKTAVLQEQKEKLMSAIGQDSYNGTNLFEGTIPGPPQMSPTQQAQPLAEQAPADPGVDINNLFNGTVTRSWGAHMSNLNEGK